VPPDDGLRLDDHHGIQAVGPKTIEQNPKGSVQARQPDAGSLVTSKNLDLVAKSGHLQLQLHAGSEAGKEAVENGNDDPAHAPMLPGIPLEKRGFLRRMGFMEGTGRCTGGHPSGFRNRGSKYLK
jgi:hypothetical protein